MIFDSLFYSMRNANSQKYVIGSSPEASPFLTEKKGCKGFEDETFFPALRGWKWNANTSYQFVSFGALTLFLRPANLYFSHIPCKHKRSFHTLDAMRCERDIQSIKVALSIQIFSGLGKCRYTKAKEREGEESVAISIFGGGNFICTPSTEQITPDPRKLI